MKTLGVKSKLKVGRPSFAEHVSCLRLFQFLKADLGDLGQPVLGTSGEANVNPQLRMTIILELHILL